jgi:hypothetical protein
MVLAKAPAPIATPAAPFGSATDPVAVVPMKFPAIVFEAAPSSIRTP